MENFTDCEHIITKLFAYIVFLVRVRHSTFHVFLSFAFSICLWLFRLFFFQFIFVFFIFWCSNILSTHYFRVCVASNFVYYFVCSFHVCCFGWRYSYYSVLFSKHYTHSRAHKHFFKHMEAYERRMCCLNILILCLLFVDSYT